MIDSYIRFIEFMSVSATNFVMTVVVSAIFLCMAIVFVTTVIGAWGYSRSDGRQQCHQSCCDKKLEETVDISDDDNHNTPKMA